MDVFGVIMAGGGGTRLWPLSRRQLPKQFLDLSGGGVLVNETFDRLNRVTDKENIYVVTNALYRDKTLEVMGDRMTKERVLAEPAARNTAACIGYAAMEIVKKRGDGIMCVMPSDHYIKNEALYVETVKRAVELAGSQDCLVTMGIKPEYPATGYGYIKGALAEGALGYYTVEEFVEKPIEEVAREYIEAGCYFWNSGMFIWKASLILRYFERLLPDIYECLQQIGDAMGTEKETEVLEQVYPVIPKISIDYGIMERADKVLMLEGDFGWNDIGSLDTLDVLHESDRRGNVSIGNSVLVDTDGTICYAKDKLVVVAHVKNLMVVESEDTILICPKENAQDVKNIVDHLDANGYDRYL